MDDSNGDAAPKADLRHRLAVWRRTPAFYGIELEPRDDRGRNACQWTATEKADDRKNYRDHRPLARRSLGIALDGKILCTGRRRRGGSKIWLLPGQRRALR